MRTLPSKFLLFASLSLASAAWAVPVRIAFVPEPDKSVTFVLEIASDASFETILHKTNVRNSADYSWDAPNEGVFFWHLTREPAPGHDGAADEFLDGSFAVIADKTTGPTPIAQLVWDETLGAAEYQVRTYVNGKPSTSATTTRAEHTERRGIHPVVLEVTIPDFSIPARRYVQGLRFEVEPPPPAAPPPVEPELSLQDDSAPAAAPAVVVPPPPKVLPPPVPQSNRRIYLIQGGLSVAQEQIEVRKLELVLSSQRILPGVQLLLQTRPLTWLSITGGASYHRHTATLEQPEILQDETVSLASNRLNFDLSPGWDMIDTFAPESNHALILNAALAFASFPVIPGDFQNGGGAAPTLNTKSLGYFGGGLGYAYYGQAWALCAQGAMMFSQTTATEESSLSIGRFWGEWSPNLNTAVSVGAFVRRNSYTYCSSDNTDCLAYGKSQSFADEAGIFVGYGLALR